MMPAAHKPPPDNFPKRRHLGEPRQSSCRRWTDVAAILDSLLEFLRKMLVLPDRQGSMPKSLALAQLQTALPSSPPARCPETSRPNAIQEWWNRPTDRGRGLARA